ncbi:uncharacterized protein (DUF433 family) [Herbihabitans rhizosphaerae]|uniref:Uncharacterized protein (DUF433 family) n=1 Tax=Herbihabitans rhizosphaerae TaxID=1872711 RepID=A0A4Q7KM35_9PSEU|nr:DUF433 domain-containing protein [Herbihabitans rhizosphaerae]RZS37728.1 uncharacterized protein (DUF433 family) [Herbihabitans rhizosphaerae]
MSVSVLEREMYSEAEAARLLRVSQSTLNYWLEGGVRRNKTYSPVIRSESKGHRAPVTWAEFIEAGLLRQYRRTHRVPMAELRAFIDRLRNRLGVPYPLADRRPYVLEKQLVLEAQDEAGLAPEFCLVAEVRQQLVLTAPSESFFERVTWEGDLATGWRPHGDDRSLVRMTPDVRFGRPAVRGISTEALWEQVDSGEDIEVVADLFDLSIDDVRWAIAYEASVRAA